MRRLLVEPHCAVCAVRAVTRALFYALRYKHGIPLAGVSFRLECIRVSWDKQTYNDPSLVYLDNALWNLRWMLGMVLTVRQRPRTPVKPVGLPARVHRYGPMYIDRSSENR